MACSSAPKMHSLGPTPWCAEMALWKAGAHTGCPRNLQAAAHSACVTFVYKHPLSTCRLVQVIMMSLQGQQYAAIGLHDDGHWPKCGCTRCACKRTGSSSWRTPLWLP
jgi:hypothetical protein